MDNLVDLNSSAEFLRTVKAATGQDDAQFSLASVRINRAIARITALEASLAEAEGRVVAVRRQALEEAAKVAEQWLEPIMATPHENATYRSIAKAIRALKDSPPPPTV